MVVSGKARKKIETLNHLAQKKKAVGKKSACVLVGWVTFGFQISNERSRPFPCFAPMTGRPLSPRSVQERQAAVYFSRAKATRVRGDEKRRIFSQTFDDLIQNIWHDSAT